MSAGLFSADTAGFGVGLPTGPKTHWLGDVAKSLTKPWQAIRYEADGDAIHVVVEYSDGARERVCVRNEQGEYQW